MAIQMWEIDIDQVCSRVYTGLLDDILDPSGGFRKN